MTGPDIRPQPDVNHALCIKGIRRISRTISIYLIKSRAEFCDSRFVMEELSAMSRAIELIELSRRVASMAPIIDQINQQDLSSMRTDINMNRSHLLELLGSFERNDIERIIVQCIESGANASAVLKRLGTTDYSERMQFAFNLRAGLSGLDKQLSTFVLRWIQYVTLLPLNKPDPDLNSEHYSEVRQLLHRASEVCWKYLPLRHTRCFPPPANLRQPYGSAFLHLLTSNIPASDREACERNMKNHILTEIYSGKGQLSIHAQINDPALEKDIQRVFLWRLRDPYIGYQEAKACELRGSSFNWLFEASNDRDGNGTSFRDWATSSSSSHPTFWITGKPGSGKSILMEEIYERFSRSESLSRQTNIVSYFFVRDGPHQKGVRGLVQSILYQLLSKNPELIPLVAPSRWDTLVLFGEDPKPIDTAEFQQMLISTLRRHYSTIILVDGLDYCEETEGSCEIPELLGRLSTCPGVKACISSRPSPNLQSLIDGSPSLILDHCNNQDIEEYISSKIKTRLTIKRGIMISLSIEEQLIHELVMKAEGCFLWVAVVIDALQAPHADEHESDELLRYVRNVPKGLTELFRCLLDDLDASQPFIASALRFIATFDQPITPIRLALMEMPFPDFAVQRDISYVSRKELLGRSPESLRRIIGASRGLLRVVAPLNKHDFEVSDWDSRIALTHKTLKEFIRPDTIQGGQLDVVGLGDFAARYSAASLSILKISHIGELTLQSVLAEAIRCSYISMFAEREDEVHISHILDELEWTSHTLLASSHPVQSPWSDVETNHFTYYYEPIQQLMMEKMLSGMTYSPELGDKISAEIRMRAMSLCAKYSITGWTSLQNTMYRWPLCQGQVLFHECQRYQRDIKCNSPMLHGSDVERGKNYTAPFPSEGIERWNTGSTEGCDQSNPKSNMESIGAIHRDDFSPADDSDQISWESWSSAEFSLDDAHPLMALKKEATDAVFQGFIEYRKRQIQETE
ncbi:hypothetical protein NPX13_g3675 [Xylaria arbuscula]|uniref:Nephrocystin 3-like N-terminal domain-containing protein n=1 Tax=Xylaria arbuscula TaxID=114810 RepID=A0A9W8TN03_9PEZI|nr:hypothetical protein NPX13_g3675 [Xylaria arbuscula]